MPDPEFSEFQFAYSVTRELEHRIFPASTWVPHFPTQNQEGERGYDLNFSDGVSSLFLQYKRSKKLQDKRAKTEHWNIYHSEFFRFKVRTANKPGDMEQHELLCRLADGDAPVYYVAPEFIRWIDYQRYARNEVVIDNSVFIDCETAPRPTDTDQHYICHRPTDSTALFFSEDPDTVRTVRGGQSLSGELAEFEPQFTSFQEARAEFHGLRSSLIETLGVEEKVNPDFYTGDGQAEWIHNQQRFFHEVFGISLQFFETPP
jgi:hypothetical protein